MRQKETKKKWIKRIGCVLLFAMMLFAGICFFMKSPAFEVTLRKSEIHLELGEALDTNPASYLEGEDWCVAMSVVDASKVKKNRVGRYPLMIRHGFDTYTMYVDVTDTTPPQVSMDIKNLVVKTGEIVSVHSLGLDIEDYSEIESIAFTKIASSKFYTGLSDEEAEEIEAAYLKGIPMNAEEFRFSYGGIYTLSVSVKDAFANTSDVTLTLTVEEPPFLDVDPHFYIVKGNVINFSEYVTAWDFIDGDLKTEDIEIDTAELDFNKTGTYEVYFTATDSYGLSRTAYTNVHIYTQEDLQEKVNTHAISISEDTIAGAINPYDSGYYETENIAVVQENILPALVHLENDALTTFGKGYIISIDEEFVTICTNEHVITNDLNVDITFYDGSICTGSVVAVNKEEDIAFIRIPIDGKNAETSLDSAYVKNLRTVHINEGYWNELANDCEISIGYICIDVDGSIWRQNQGYMVEKSVKRSWNEYENISECIISMEPIAGTSGSAIFDGYGHLVAMVRGYTEYEGYTETVAVPLSRILKFYEFTFREKAQYQ